MQNFANWAVTSEAMQDAYILILMAVMVLPMIGLALWYHSNQSR